MFGAKEPDFFGALDVDSGNSMLFIPRLPEEYVVWMGKWVLFIIFTLTIYYVCIYCTIILVKSMTFVL